ncbi:uncharacterized protein LOC131954213 [Physella acuta]|uniref:uncharacterized protein LOC131954213 n=1 Tax=Physella acuta TaxID=109671 RepID=UPI0027DE2AD3|nr:uncharacterized protein LOC131954213 [Physella acuta]
MTSQNTLTSIGVISFDLYTTLLAAFAVMWFAVCISGTLGNYVNIQTFVAMGLNDGVTVTFLVLSILDLCYILVCLAMSVGTMLIVIEYKIPKVVFSVQPYAIGLTFGNIGVLFSSNIQLVTTFLSIARCMCIAKPLHFKFVFTRNVCCAVLFVISCFTLLANLPVLATTGIVPIFDPSLNLTRPSFWTSENRNQIKNIIWAVTEIFVPFATQIIVIVCLVVMASCLRQSSKFRASSSTLIEQTNINANSGKKNNLALSVYNLSGKELQVIRQVAVVSLVYIVCNTPKIISNSVTEAIPEYNVGNKFTNLYMVIFSLRKLFELVNSSVSLPIYYRCNGKFRTLCTFRINQIKFGRFA